MQAASDVAGARGREAHVGGSMSFGTGEGPPRRIAVVGGGISGIGAAFALSPAHRVMLFEAAPRLGGHARTVVAGRRGDRPVDTGFIVFNPRTYPGLTRLFAALDVPVAPSDMSFAASFGAGRFEYGLRNLSAVVAQPANLARPRFVRMLRDILRFNARAEAVATDPRMTVADLLDRLGTGAWFRDRYLLPLSGAIWSSPTRDMLRFPAFGLVRFFRNHALLSHRDQHPWQTVRGGSAAYVSRLAAALVRRGVQIRTGAAVRGVRRTAAGPELRPAGGVWARFDDVVLAVHADEALRLLADPTGVERTALAAIRYRPNEAVLHADPRAMPRRRRVWSSWNYVEAMDTRPDRITLTYWMNALQAIPRDDPLFVSLNAERSIRPEFVYDATTFRHPVYDLEAEAAQGLVRALNGGNRTWFCGAWLGNGFHEDALQSGLAVAERIAAARPAVAAE